MTDEVIYEFIPELVKEEPIQEGQHFDAVEFLIKEHRKPQAPGKCRRSARLSFKGGARRRLFLP